MSLFGVEGSVVKTAIGTPGFSCSEPFRLMGFCRRGQQRTPEVAALSWRATEFNENSTDGSGLVCPQDRNIFNIWLH